ncbi:MAG TPA: diguanylate cyclase, partial [Thermoanaerobaculia bacterium]
PSRDGSRIWMAADEGLASLRRTASGWQYDGLHPKIQSTLYRITLHDGALWCATLLDGVLRVDAQGNVKQFGTDAMSMTLVGGKPLFAGNGRLYRLGSNGQLIDDPSRPAPPARFRYLIEDRDGTLWFDSRPPHFLRRGARDAHPLTASLSGEVFRVRAEADGVTWFATDRGLFRLGASGTSNGRAQMPPMIRRIAARESLLFGGFGAIPSVALPYSFGRLRVEFAPLSFRDGATYQYRLEPLDTDWSAWTRDSFVDYTNLGEGSYTLRVRSRAATGETSDAASWSFTVQPPWFRTPWAIALWIVVATALVLVIVRLRTHTLRKRAAVLSARVEEQTVELQKTVEQLRVAQSSLVEKNEMLEDTNALLAQANVRLEKLSLVDALTSLANRREFDRALVDEWERARRRQEPVSLILLDLDHFKRLNDTHGHPAGDEALRRVGRFLRETIRGSGDVVARYGGEEFAVILPGVQAPEAMQVAERLRAGVEELAIESVGVPRLTISCGVGTVIVSDGREPRMLLDRADRALYAAKRAGRNRVHIEVDDAASQQATPHSP